LEKEDSGPWFGAQLVRVPEIFEHERSLFLPKLAEIGRFCDPILVGFVLFDDGNLHGELGTCRNF
jgi:hypothetical protein